MLAETHLFFLGLTCICKTVMPKKVHDALLADPHADKIVRISSDGDG